MRIHISYAPTRPKPKQGDLRRTKKHGLQVRVHERHDGMMVVGSAGRYRYDWITLTAENVKLHHLEHFKLVIPETAS